MFTTLLTISTVLISLSFDSAIGIVFVNNRHAVSTYVFMAALFTLLNGIIVEVVFYLFDETFAQFTGLSYQILFLAPVITFLNFWFLVITKIFQMSEQVRNYSLFQIISAILGAVFSLILVVHFNFGWFGRVLGILIASFTVGLISIYFIVKNQLLSFKIESSFAKYLIGFGLGLLPHSLGIIALNNINRFIIINFLSLDEVGFFSLAQTASGVFVTLTSAINISYLPWLYRNLSINNEQSKAKIVNVSYLIALIELVLGIILYFLIFFAISNFVDKKYLPSTQFLFWLILAGIFQGWYFLFTNIIIHAGKTLYQSGITILVGVLSILINYFLISKFGSAGIGPAFAISFFLLFGFSWGAASIVSSLPWFNSKLFRAFIRNIKM